MASSIDRCIFCGDQDISRLTKEHVWPRWTHNDINRSMKRWNGIRGHQRIESDIIEAAERRTTKHGGDIHDMQIKCVCGGGVESCNNGWMRRFEERARPILLPLINGGKVRLSPEHQRVVAGWAALKAMVVEFGPLSYVTATQSDRDRLKAVQLPPQRGWGIWIGNYKRGHWSGYLGSNPFLFWPEPERAHMLGVPTTEFNGKSSFQVVKKLYIQILHCQSPELVENWQFNRGAAKFLRRIWPPSGYSVVWPPPEMSDAEAEDVSSAFAREMTSRVRNWLARSGEAPVASTKL